jgi:hypothetical protein
MDNKYPDCFEENLQRLKEINGRCRKLAQRLRGYGTRLQRGSMTHERYVVLAGKAARELEELQLTGMELLRQAADAVAVELEGGEEDERRKLP